MAKHVMLIQVIVDDAEHTEADPGIEVRCLHLGDKPISGPDWAENLTPDHDAEREYLPDDRKHVWQNVDMYDLASLGWVTVELVLGWQRDCSIEDMQG